MLGFIISFTLELSLTSSLQIVFLSDSTDGYSKTSLIFAFVTLIALVGFNIYGYKIAHSILKIKKIPKRYVKRPNRTNNSKIIQLQKEVKIKSYQKPFL